jgi:hypothetical protein
MAGLRETCRGDRDGIIFLKSRGNQLDQRCPATVIRAQRMTGEKVSCLGLGQVSCQGLEFDALA